jgi:hypothetical protein
MPRIEKIFQMCFFCHDCKVVVPIIMTHAAAKECARHADHLCEYAVIKP